MSGLIRQSIGKRKSYLLGLIQSAKILRTSVDPTNASLRSEVILQIEEAIVKLQKAVEGLQYSDNKWIELVSKLTDASIEEQQYAVTASADDGYLSVIDEANELIGLLQLQLKRIQTLIQKPEQQNSSPSHSNNVRLPKLEFPKFDGDVYEWAHFWTIFSTAVHSTDLSAVQKFSYLTSNLKGPALDCISGLHLSAENYEVALGLLRSRFEKTSEFLIGGLYSRLKRIQTSTREAQAMRRTLDHCTKILRQLENAGEDVNSNRSLVLDVLSKFPCEALQEMCRQKQVGTHSKLNDILVALQEYLDESDSIHELMDDLSPFSNTSHEKEKRFKGKLNTTQMSQMTTSNDDVTRGPTHHTSSHTSAFTVTERTTATRPSNPCYFCEGGHYNSQCQTYRSFQDRIKRLEELNRCSRCLRFNHVAGQCRIARQSIQCFFCRKVGSHVSPLCPEKFGHSVDSSTGAKLSSSASNDKQTNNKKPTSNEMCSLSIDEKSALATAVAFIINPLTGAKQKARIILDNGSHRTYIVKSLANDLKLATDRHDDLTISIFGTTRSLSVSTSQVEFAIGLRNGEYKRVVAHTTPMITRCELSPIVLPRTAKGLIETLDDTLADDFTSVKGPPTVLIGSDYFWDFVLGTPNIRSDDGIYFIPTSLGLVLGGRYINSDSKLHEEAAMLCLTERVSISQHSTIAMIASENSCCKAPPDVDEYWSLETIGITDAPVKSDDEAAMEQFQKTVRYENGRYQVVWPWKTDDIRLPTNYKLAYGRLQSLLKRLKGAPDILYQYDKLIEDQIECGVVEDVPPDEHCISANMVHYLPHHPVIKLNASTTKIRIVYDASARCRKDQTSLNQCLYRGPILLPDLCSILIRFRLHKYAMTADIEKAFLQLGLQPSQRDVTRFIWLKNVRVPSATLQDNLRILRFARVPFGVISSPFLLGACIQHHLSTVDTELARSIRNNIYVDNVVIGVENEERVVPVYLEAKSIFSDATMNLREWCSNSKLGCESLPEADRVRNRTVTVLGLAWDSEFDLLYLKNAWGERKTCSTKRTILQAIASIFDPLGNFQPCTLPGKLLLREIWNKQLGWDEELSDDLLEKWTEFHANVEPIFATGIPRRIVAQLPNQTSTIVTFCDASAEAYAAALYIRTADSIRSNWEANIIFSKSRLAPRVKSQQDITIPRLELLGVLIGLRAAIFVRAAVSASNDSTIILLTDSTTVLSWLRSTKQLPRFVANRVKEIRQAVNVTFKYVRSESNPADLCTRGLSGTELLNNELWWKGPCWLAEDTSEWPSHPDINTFCSEDLVDLQESYNAPPVFHTFIAPDGACETTTPCGIDHTTFSSLRRLIRVTAIILKFLNTTIWKNLSIITKDKWPILSLLMANITDGNITRASDLKQARWLWIKMAQGSHLEDVIVALKTDGRHQLINQLGLFLDESGIIRCRGRFGNSNLPSDAKEPIFLPRKDHFTNLVISDIHERLFHSGPNHTLCEIRRQFWIPQGRIAVRQIITGCLICKKHKGRPFALPKMPDLPTERVSKAAPFEFTGIDYFGPVKVTLPTSSDAQKMWICLFTCLTIRAIHLEWVSDCTAQTFIDCLSRFISRRGCPSLILSDNAPQFKLAKSICDKMWISTMTHSSVLSFIADKGISWKFTIEFAPWQGGVYERLISTIKSAFSCVVGRKLLSWNEFATIISEIEAMVNSRPIVFVGSELEMGSCLRPVDFLTDLSTGTPDIDPQLRPTGGEAEKCLVRYYKARQRRLNSLWETWEKDYLASLRERYRITHKANRSDIKATPAVNDVVIIKNADNPRGTWKMGRVRTLISSSDSVVRAAELILPNGMVIRRPLSHLYPLEMASQDSSLKTTNRSASQTDKDDDVGSFHGFSESDVLEAEEALKAKNNTAAE